MRFVTLIIATLLLAGCSKYLPKLDEVLPDRTKDYKKSESLPDLEVPPDLTSEGIRDTMAVPDVDDTGVATYTTYQERISARKEARRLEENPLAIQTLADEKVLVLAGQPAQVWTDLRAFWRGNGFELDLDDQELGIMETKWLEDQVSLQRDRFKVFVEPGADRGTTVLYVSHTGEEMLPVGEDLVWSERGRDYALEDAILTRMNNSLGGISAAAASSSRASRAAPVSRAAETRSRTVAPQTRQASQPDDDGFKAPVSVASQPATPVAATAPLRSPVRTASTGPAGAEVVSAGAGKYYINLPQSFAQAWLSTEQALQRSGLTVEEADRDFGVFHVRLSGQGGQKKKSLWKKLSFWSDDDNGIYQVSLTGVGAKTEVVILDAEGKWDDSDTANNLLKELNDQLNR